MVKVIKLPAGDCILKLEVDRRTRWARVYFDDCRNKTSTNLGEEILWKLCTRFISALEKDFSEKEPAGIYNGVELFWVTTLNDGYNIFYCSYLDDKTINFHLQSPNNDFFHDFRLDQQTADEWKSMLKKYVKK